MTHRQQLRQRQPVAVVQELNMLITLQLTVEEINQVLAAMNAGLVEKIKGQAMAQIQAQENLKPATAE